MLDCFNLTICLVLSTSQRVQSHYGSAIGKIFIDNSKLENYTVEPLINGLSDHEAQLIKINDIDLHCGSQQYQTV
jgi:hypothetical protein